MAYSEYLDLYFNCQDHAPYHLFVYDMVGSKQYPGAERQEQLMRLIFGLEAKIQQKERETGKQILHRKAPILHGVLVQENGHYKIKAQKRSDQIFREDLVDPACIQGDCLVLTVLRDQITNQEVDLLFEETKRELQIPYDFHKADGYYETDDWTEGKTHYFRGYAIALLSYFHKDTTKQILQSASFKLEKTLIKTK